MQRWSFTVLTSGDDEDEPPSKAVEAATQEPARGWHPIRRAGGGAGKEGPGAATGGAEEEPWLDGGAAEELLDGAWSAVGHPVRTSCLEPWPQPAPAVGASILAFSTDPQHDRVYVWLGKERKVLTWGAGSHRWSDFGGGRARGDADAADTAAREFVQETAGCVRYFEADGPGVRAGHADIADSLRRGQYVLRLETALPPLPGRAGAPLFVTYVVQVPWDPRAAMRFAHCRALLSALSKRLARKELDAAEREALMPDDPSRRAARERWVLFHPAVRRRDRAVPRAMLTGDPRDDGTERATVVESVDAAYLEKWCLDLWSVPQLTRALRYDGMLSNRDGGVESLRPGFTAVLTEALEELRGAFPMHFADEHGRAFPAVTFEGAS